MVHGESHKAVEATQDKLKSPDISADRIPYRVSWAKEALICGPYLVRLSQRISSPSQTPTRASPPPKLLQFSQDRPELNGRSNLTNSLLYPTLRLYYHGCQGGYAWFPTHSLKDPLANYFQTYHADIKLPTKYVVINNQRHRYRRLILLASDAYQHNLLLESSIFLFHLSQSVISKFWVGCGLFCLGSGFEYRSRDMIQRPAKAQLEPNLDFLYHTRDFCSRCVLQSSSKILDDPKKLVGQSYHSRQ